MLLSFQVSFILMNEKGKYFVWGNAEYGKAFTATKNDVLEPKEVKFKMSFDH